MNPNPIQLLTKLQSRLTIRQAQQTITTEKQAMSLPKYQVDPEKMWTRFKTGDTEHAFLTSRAGKDTIGIAAREVNELSGGPPSATENESKAETAWRLARQGKGRDFYTNGDAKDVLFIAAAEYNALVAAKAAKDARAAAIAKAKAEAAAASTPPQKSSSATAPDRTLTGLAAATAIHKQKAAPVSVKSAPAPSATAPEASTPAPSRPLHGLAKAIAAAKGEKVTHAPSAPPSGLAKATAIHKAQAESRK